MQQHKIKFESKSAHDRGSIMYFRGIEYTRHGDSIIGWYSNSDAVSSDDYYFSLALHDDELLMTYACNVEDFGDPIVAEILITLKDNYYRRGSKNTKMNVFEWLEYDLSLRDRNIVPYHGQFEYQNDIYTLPSRLRKQIESIYESYLHDELYPLYCRLKFKSLLNKFASSPAGKVEK